MNRSSFLKTLAGAAIAAPVLGSSATAVEAPAPVAPQGAPTPASSGTLILEPTDVHSSYVRVSTKPVRCPEEYPYVLHTTMVGMVGNLPEPPRDPKTGELIHSIEGLLIRVTGNSAEQILRQLHVNACMVLASVENMHKGGSDEAHIQRVKELVALMPHLPA